MKIRKQEKILAKKLLAASTTNSKLNFIKVKNLVSAVKNSQKSNSIRILYAYYKALEALVRKSTLIVETPDNLRPQQLENIKEKFGGENVTLVVKENRELLGGFKLRLDDSEWDFSIKSKIDQIKESINA